MQYFNTVDNLLFYKNPISFTKHTEKDILKYAIGANMYCPGTQTNLFEKLIHNKFQEVGAITLCLEDAIAEEELEIAEKNVIQILKNLYNQIQIDSQLEKQLPLLFIRVRSVEQFKSFSEQLEQEELSVLTGFNFPKFNSHNGREYFKTLKYLSLQHHEILYGMPILEDRLIIHKETRFEELKRLQYIFNEFDDYLLNIRVGATDFSSLFGLRRNKYTTIYDLRIISDCLTDILNFFLRKDKDYVISGPVWEYFSWNENSIENKTFQKELQLDIQNGFQGKTIIHPSQINIVNKSYIVDYYDYQDAYNILHTEEHGGVFKSKDGDRMNEVNPHRTWAKRILSRAEIFGVADKTAEFKNGK